MSRFQSMVLETSETLVNLTIHKEHVGTLTSHMSVFESVACNPTMPNMQSRNAWVKRIGFFL